MAMSAAVTDQNGVTSIALSKPGLGIDTVRHKIPYPDRSLCDDDVFRFSITFWVGETFHTN